MSVQRLVPAEKASTSIPRILANHRVEDDLHELGHAILTSQGRATHLFSDSKHGLRTRRQAMSYPLRFLQLLTFLGGSVSQGQKSRDTLKVWEPCASLELDCVLCLRFVLFPALLGQAVSARE
jgi:hypothetical protein